MLKKINALFIITTVFFIAACNNQAQKENEKLKAEVAMLARENAELAGGAYILERSVESYHSMLKEIDRQIAAIDEKHLTIKNKNSEFTSDKEVEQDILMHLDHLQHMTENAKHKIAHLSKTMNELRKENQADHEQIHKMDIYINDLAHLVVKRDHQIEALHQELEKKGASNAAIYRVYKKQKEYSDVLLEIINSAFYFSGTNSQLKQYGIIDTQGGFIGLGKVKMLNADAPVEFFEPIDMRLTKSFNLDARNVNLITPHPSDSYELIANADTPGVSLKITNDLKFWQETNFLVIEITD